jgi:tRNA1(Val) A37 N6-methylase TrmN6
MEDDGSCPRFPDLTDDAILGGRLRLWQPRRGHRFGHDAILLAAATPALAGQTAVEFGAGVGAAGLALAARVPDLRVTLVEIDAELAELAGENAARNALTDRVATVVLDVAAPAAAFAAMGLPPGSCDHALMNPPFNDPDRHRVSAEPLRRAAHALEGSSLDRWIAAALWLLKSGGMVTVIFRADRVIELLSVLCRDFGAITLLPIHGKPGAKAIRVIATAVKGSRAAAAILPGLVLTTEAGATTPATEAVLRHSAALTLIG